MAVDVVLGKDFESLTWLSRSEGDIFDACSGWEGALGTDAG